MDERFGSKQLSQFGRTDVLLVICGQVDLATHFWQIVSAPW